MKTFLTTAFFLFISYQVISQERGFINDADGYTNLRKAQLLNSEITGVIVEGQVFTYYTNNSSNWYKVEFGNRIGYLHQSRIANFENIKVEIDDFFKIFYETGKLNVEKSQNNNEQLFELTKKYPLAVIEVFCDSEPKIQEFLLKEYSSPIHDKIDLQLVFSRLLSEDVVCNKSNYILQLLQEAAKNIDKELAVRKTFMNSLKDYNNSQNYPLPVNQYFVSEINGQLISYFLNHHEIDMYSKMYYQGQLAVSDNAITFSILDSIFTKNEDTRPFYLYNFNSILSISDGALTEYISIKCHEFLKKSPCVFVENLRGELSESIYKKWMDFIDFEYYLLDNSSEVLEEDFDKFQKEISENCSENIGYLKKIRRDVRGSLDRY